MLSEKSKRSSFLIVAIEGPDYSGKSTVAEFVTNKFNASANHINTNPKSTQYACHFRRPGGSYACDNLRNIVTDTVMDSETRQVVAFAEEVLFHYTVPPFHKLFVLDRFNPISGQVYGPESTKKYWRFLVESGIIKVPDLTIFINTDVDKLLERVKSRGDKKDVMDDYFCSQAHKISERYTNLKNEEWFNKYFHHVTVLNDSSLEDLQDVVYKIIESKLRSKNV